MHHESYCKSYGFGGGIAISKMRQQKIWDNLLVKKVTKGTVFGKWVASGISLDSRNIKKGEIFVAFEGERVDGHDYVLEAFKNGAVAAIVTRIPHDCDEKKHNLIVVKDVLRALENLAIFNRKRSKAKIIAVTGSVGKTSTKEQLKLVFSKFGKTYSNIGNYNGRLGLPICLASMPLDTEYGIFELGMSYPGEMEARSKVAQPDIAIITGVFACHIENFDSLEGIAKAKAEIFRGMGKSGVAIVNGDNSYRDVLIKEAKKHDLKKIITFGEGKNNDSILTSCKALSNCTEAHAEIFSKSVKFKLMSYGIHHAVNALGVLSAVSILKLDLKIAAKALSKFNNVKGRGIIEEVVTRTGKTIHLIDDSYNANPTSVRAALVVLGEVGAGKRKLAVLSDMRELGSIAVEEHKKLREPIEKHKIDKVITVGPLMKNLYDALPEINRFKHFASYNEVVGEIDKLVENSDYVLVKGSNGTMIYELVNYLKGKK